MKIGHVIVLWYIVDALFSNCNMSEPSYDSLFYVYCRNLVEVA